MPKLITGSLIVVAFVSGFFLKSALDRRIEPTGAPHSKKSELHLGAQGLINPLLDCGPSSQPVRNSDLRDSVQKQINNARKRGLAENVSVYFRDLNNGPVFGIDENVRFVPASLLKVPLLISYFKMRESDPGYLSSAIAFQPKRHLVSEVSPLIQPPTNPVPETPYPIGELLARMITLSDNTAASMLASREGINVEKTLTEMGVYLLRENNDVWLTVDSYASIFRILYNATYLSRQFSEAALDLLTRCEFREGLPRGVPPQVRVAHKFGERTMGGTSQFHDCGIVYHPKRPYLLCVMSRGKKMETLVQVVAEISKAVYDGVDEGSN